MNLYHLADFHDTTHLSIHRCSILTKCKIRSNSGFSTLVMGVSDASVDRALVVFFVCKKGLFYVSFF